MGRKLCPFCFSADSQEEATKKKKTADPYQSENEQKRVAASAPKRDVRFQYRLTAVDHALKSADLLPKSSQAFAAVLCEATEWVINRQPQTAKAIYERYLHQGTYVPWGRAFGRRCPPPNFAAVSTWSIASRQAKHLIRHAKAHPLYASVLTIFILALSALCIYYVYTWRVKRIPTPPILKPPSTDEPQP